MIKTFTPNDVLLYISKELPPAELIEFEEQLSSDQELMGYYIQCVTAFGLLKRAVVEPSEKSTNFILNYAKRPICR